MENNYYVYEYFIIDTGEVFYVGKGKNDRAFKYKRNKFCEDMKNTHEWNIRIVNENLMEEDAFNKERDLIKYYRDNTNYRLTNQTDGGDGVSGWKPPQTFRIKQSNISKERWNSDGFREKMIEIRRDEDGIFHSKKFKQKMSSITKGSLNGNYNNRWDDEQKLHLSIIRKELSLAKGTKNPKSKKIMCVENGKIFDYIRLAQKEYKVKSEASFSVALDNPRRTCSDLHWVTITTENIQIWSSEFNRRQYIIYCLSKNRFKTPIICIETNQLFITKKELMKYLNIGQKKLEKILANNEEFNEYHYKIVTLNRSPI
jgi:hypothetical protein